MTRRVHDAGRQLHKGPSIQARPVVHLDRGRDLRDSACDLYPRSPAIHGCLHRPARRDRQSTDNRRSESHNVNPGAYHYDSPRFAPNEHHRDDVNDKLDYYHLDRQRDPDQHYYDSCRHLYHDDDAVAPY